LLWQVQNFGEPFFLVVKENETLAGVKARIQNKLQVVDEDFSKVCDSVCLDIVMLLHYNAINLFSRQID
jgi:hypothetical protein